MTAECMVQGCRAATWAELDTSVALEGSTIRTAIALCGQHYDELVASTVGKLSIDLEPLNGPKHSPTALDWRRCPLIIAKVRCELSSGHEGPCWAAGRWITGDAIAQVEHELDR